MPERILVLGGSGTLGIPVARALLADNQDVRVLARNPVKAAEKLGDQVEIVEGDPVDSRSMEAALSGVTGVHISLPASSELRAVELVTDMGATAGIRRVSYVSGTSVCEENRWFDLIDRKWRAEDLLRRSDLAHTVFCPTWVMEVIPNFLKRGRAVIIKGRNPPAFHFFAARDFGAMVAASYRTDEVIGRRLFIHGPEAITLSEAITAYRQACHPERRIMSLRPWQARWLARLSRQAPLREVAMLIQYFDRTDELGDPAEANRLLGAPTTTLRQWIHEGNSAP